MMDGGVIGGYCEIGSCVMVMLLSIRMNRVMIYVKMGWLMKNWVMFV